MLTTAPVQSELDPQSPLGRAAIDTPGMFRVFTTGIWQKRAESVGMLVGEIQGFL